MAIQYLLLELEKEEVVLTVFSTDSKSTLVKIPYDILGKKDLPLVDYFKEKLEYKFVGNNAYLVCPPHKSYILLCKKKHVLCFFIWRYKITGGHTKR